MKRIVAVAFILALVFACQKKEEKAQYQFPTGGGPLQGGALHGQDDVKMLKDLLAKDPKNLGAWIELGNKTMDSGRYGEAVEAYGKALEIDPKNVDVRVDYGTCLRSTGKPDLAIKEYKKALEINPNHLNANKNMGVVLAYDLKDSAGAIKAFEKAIQVAPGAHDAQQLRMEVERLKAGK